MADETPAAPTPQDGKNNAAPAPSYNLVGQYIRDLSFESPGAPGTILAGGPSPQFTVSINVSVKKQADDLYAVELLLNAKAEREKVVLFNVELAYGGVFRLRNVTEQQLAPLLMVECPRLVFPFARQVLANTVQQGGFPPLMMEPVDFQALYIQNLRNLQTQKQQQAGSGESAPAASAPESDVKPN